LQNSVNHRIFERTLRPLVFRGARLFERHFNPQAWLGDGPSAARRGPKRVGRRGSWALSVARVNLPRSGAPSTAAWTTPRNFVRLASDQAGIPAELKHINKRRKRNQQGLPQ
jgi:hypothetical protein